MVCRCYFWNALTHAPRSPFDMHSNSFPWISLFPSHHHSRFCYTILFIFNLIYYVWAEHVHKPFIWFERIFSSVYNVHLRILPCKYSVKESLYEKRNKSKQNTCSPNTSQHILWCCCCHCHRNSQKVLNSLLFVVIWMCWLHIWAVLWLRYAIALTVCGQCRILNYLQSQLFKCGTC